MQGFSRKYKLNEKTFRDCGSGFVEILSYRLWDNRSKTGAWKDKIKKFYL